MSSNLGLSISLGQGGTKGRTSVGISGAWYGEADAFQGNISPLLARLPKAASSTITPGSYIDSVKVLAQGDPVNTNTRPDTKDTFYAKSLMTTQDSPMSNDALLAFAKYLSKEGWATKTVGSLGILSCLTDIRVCVCRIGLSCWISTAVPTRQSAKSHLMRRRSPDETWS